MKKKIIFIAMAVCVVGFISGAVYVRTAQPVSADGRLTNRAYIEKVEGEVVWSEAQNAKVWDDRRYEYTVFDGDSEGVMYVERIADTESMDTEYVYTVEDEKKIIDAMLEVRGEMVKDVSLDNFNSYKEIYDGYPTGTVIAFTYDDNGKLYFIGARQGDTYDVSGVMVADNTLYDTAVEAVMEKYGDANVVINTKADEAVYKIINVPKEGLCYEYEIEAQYKITDEDTIDAVFYPRININNNTCVEVLSTLGY